MTENSGNATGKPFNVLLTRVSTTQILVTFNMGMKAFSFEKEKETVTTYPFETVIYNTFKDILLQKIDNLNWVECSTDIDYERSRVSKIDISVLHEIWDVYREMKCRFVGESVKFLNHCHLV